MTNLRWFIAAVLLALTLAGANRAIAQVTVKAEDLIGVWEAVSAKDLKTGNALPGLSMRTPPANGYSLRALIGRFSP